MKGSARVETGKFDIGSASSDTSYHHHNYMHVKIESKQVFPFFPAPSQPSAVAIEHDIFVWFNHVVHKTILM